MATSPYIYGNTSLFGSRPMYQTAPRIPASAARPPAPTSAANLQALLALSGQDRANAFLKGLGAMGPALIAAGAPSTDPGAAQKNIALAGQLRAKTTQDDLTRQRAAGIQTLTTQMALQKAAQEKALFDQKMQRAQSFNKFLNIPNATALDQTAMIPSAVGGATGAAPLAATSAQTPSAAVAMPQPQVPAAAANQSQVQVGNFSVPRSVMAVAALTDDPYAEVSKYVQKTLSSANKFTPLGELTAEGRDSQERSLRDTLKKPLQEITDLGTKGNAINAALDRNSGLGDLAAINSYQRLIDPAVVRGEDVELIAAAKPIGEYFETFKDRIRAGKKLGPNQRKELREASRDFIAAKNKGFVTRLTNVKNLAVKDKLRWDRIWLGPSIVSLSGQPGVKPKTAAPQPTPRPASRINAPKVGSSSSKFTLPNQTK